jgi:DNA helicase-2/ATP-dependent DNA helicase PcrA
MNEIDPIVGEEQALLDDVCERLGRPPPTEGATEDDIIAELRRIQDDIRTAKTEDKAALEQQYERQCRLLEQLRRGKQLDGVDPESPYFAHLGTEKEGRRSDILLGRATSLENGLRIVDWRHAPVAKVYYRYQEGDEYEEDIGPRSISGKVTARRAVTINHGKIDRIVSPKGTFLREGDTWIQSDTLAPRSSIRSSSSSSRARTAARSSSAAAPAPARPPLRCTASPTSPSPTPRASPRTRCW